MKNAERVRTLEEMPTLLTLPDLMELLQIGRSVALDVIHSDGFPAFKVGRSFRISRDALARWISQQG